MGQAFLFIVISRFYFWCRDRGICYGREGFWCIVIEVASPRPLLFLEYFWEALLSICRHVLGCRELWVEAGNPAVAGIVVKDLNVTESTTTLMVCNFKSNIFILHTSRGQYLFTGRQVCIEQYSKRADLQILSYLREMLLFMSL